MKDCLRECLKREFGPSWTWPLLQLEVDRESALIQSVITPFGLYRVNVLNFGIATAPAIYQEFISILLGDLGESVVVLLHDILIGARDESELRDLEHRVLPKLSENGLKLNLQKCVFHQSAVRYLGYVIDQEGLHMMEDRVIALQEALALTDRTSSKAFFGKLGYYERFLSHHAEVCAPLYDLLRKGVDCRWTNVEQRAFEAAKNLLCSDLFMTHYDLNLPLILAVDSSPIGTGSCLSHVIPDGTERPIAYHLRRFSETESRYSQFDRELFGLMIGVRRFHQYIAGRRFRVVLDNLPAVRMLQKRIPDVASPRILRWLIKLGGNNFAVKHRSVNSHQNCDALSRCPVGGPAHDSTQTDDACLDTEIVCGIYFMTNQVLGECRLTLPEALSPGEVARATAVDPVLRKVLRWVQHGWLKKCPKEVFKPYFAKREQLTTLRDCLTYGDRVVFPDAFIPIVRELLTRLHGGLTKCHATLAR